MKLHFKRTRVEALLAHALAAPKTAPLYGTKTGRGLWLVGDQGVYLMSNGKPEPDRANDGHVAYAKECDPTQPFEEWWENKQASYGGDDGVDFLDAAFVRQALDTSTGPWVTLDVRPPVGDRPGTVEFTPQRTKVTEQ